MTYALARHAAGQVRKILVICPLAAVGVWKQEFAVQAANASLVTRNDVEKLGDVIAVLRQHMQDPLVAAVVTYEVAVRYCKFLADEYRPDLLVVDESQNIRHYASKRTKRVLAIARTVPFKLALSGTPAPNGYIDMYYQIKAIHPAVLPSRIQEFRSRYCIMGGYMGTEVIGYRNVRELAQRLARVVIRVRKDLLHLPPVLDQDVPVKLPESTIRLYRQLKKELIAQVGDKVIIVPNQVALVVRLMQVTGGCIDGLRENPKLDALVDLLDAESDKVVIFARFLPEIEAIGRRIQQQGWTWGKITGSVTGKARDELIHRFQTEPDPRILVVQTQAGGVAVTLHRAAVAIFYSYDYNAEHYEQARGRIHRGGQTKTCRYIHLVAEGTIDEVILRVLRRKVSTQQALGEVIKELKQDG